LYNHNKQQFHCSYIVYVCNILLFNKLLNKKTRLIAKCSFLYKLTFSNIERAGSLKSIKPCIQQEETQNCNGLEGLGMLNAFGFVRSNWCGDKKQAPLKGRGYILFL